MDIQVEFDKEMQRREDSIRAMASQEANIQKSIESGNISLENLNKEIEEKQTKLNGLDSEIQAKNDEYEKHVEAVQESLNKREKELNDKQSFLVESAENHLKDLSDVNDKKEKFKELKASLVEALNEMKSSIENNISQTIEEINAL